MYLLGQRLDVDYDGGGGLRTHHGGSGEASDQGENTHDGQKGRDWSGWSPSWMSMGRANGSIFIAPTQSNERNGGCPCYIAWNLSSEFPVGLV
jgi:hypothetical protein